MCAIAGAKNRKDVETMLEIMSHRAPDDRGVADSEKFVMGMGRLAIIDLKSEGLCPYKEDHYVLAFNGEIYNYLELRKELIAKGYRFRTNSDTEVLLKSYREWGAECLKKFNGMFALAIYDGERIFFARDIAGEKPLYYTSEPFAFASEAKALGFKCEEFPPAHYGYYDFRNLSIYRYWKFEPREINLKTAEEELEWLIEDSVRLRTRTDVPYALYYSGGIDSSLIKTFHEFNYEFTYENGNYQDEFIKTFEKIVWHLDYPVEHFSPFALWKLAEAASKKVTVILSGEGADELFGGYIRYVPTSLAFQARKNFPSYHSMFPYTFKDQRYFDVYDPVTAMGLSEFEGNLRVLLRMGDRMASAFGLENRCPFLDKRIIEFAFSLPPELKINNFETKVILRRILEKRNPEYKHIEKAGLYCPINKWIGSNELYEKNDYLKYQKKIWDALQK